VIDADSGRRIKEVYQVSLVSERAINGRIVEISARSFSFIVHTDAYREVTCRAFGEPMQEAVADLRNGMNVVATGYFTRRKRRDELVLKRLQFNGRAVEAAI
jgi:hypothetical protein